MENQQLKRTTSSLNSQLSRCRSLATLPVVREEVSAANPEVVEDPEIVAEQHNCSVPCILK